MTDKTGDRFVICMKWGTKYGPEYVNRLYGMVKRHLKGPVPLRVFHRRHQRRSPRSRMLSAA